MDANLTKKVLFSEGLAKKADQKTLILSLKSNFYPQNRAILWIERDKIPFLAFASRFWRHDYI